MDKNKGTGRPYESDQADDRTMYEYAFDLQLRSALSINN